MIEDIKEEIEDAIVFGFLGIIIIIAIILLAFATVSVIRYLFCGESVKWGVIIGIMSLWSLLTFMIIRKRNR